MEREMIGLYLFAAVVVAFLIYCTICIVWTMRMKEVAGLLREILEGSGWGDLMKQLVSEDYVKAILEACNMVARETR